MPLLENMLVVQDLSCGTRVETCWTYQLVVATLPCHRRAELLANLQPPVSAAESLLRWQRCCSWAAQHLLPLGTRVVAAEHHLCLR